MFKLLIPSIFTLVSIIYTPPTQELIKAKVERVIDGDTVLIKVKNDYRRLRLACIDAPELKQKDGYPSKDFLMNNLPKGTKIKIDNISKDKYNRMLGVIFNKNMENINSKSLSQGHSVIYQSFIYTCPEYKQEFLNAETFARSKKLGLWENFECFPQTYRAGRCRENKLF